MRLPFSTGAGDPETEEALEVELRDEQEKYWHRTTREHRPYLSDCSYFDTSSNTSDVITDDVYDADTDELAHYVIGKEDYYEEVLLLSTFDLVQGGLGDVQMATRHEGGHLAEEKREQQCSNV